ncbi:PREDICTED: uncharacterized protein LOC106819798 [Priapulus caudatus]|uniref:Uncharacterized protein LOC106819798 n=1 Tax=Priapulus caudatus TaxID=37621 RepID=A0ABM1F5Z9_PRICU|nr:PREDICTED: uncharacterized protein LOC106819798 [Priapulus caudatus]
MSDAKSALHKKQWQVCHSEDLEWVVHSVLKCSGLHVWVVPIDLQKHDVLETKIMGHLHSGNGDGSANSPLRCLRRRSDGCFDLTWLDLSNNAIRHIHGQTLNRMAETLDGFSILGETTTSYLGCAHRDAKGSPGLPTPALLSNLHHLKDLNLANAFTEKLEADRYITHLHEIFFYSNFSKLEFLDLTGNELSVVNPCANHHARAARPRTCCCCRDAERQHRLPHRQRPSRASRAPGVPAGSSSSQLPASGTGGDQPRFA